MYKTIILDCQTKTEVVNCESCLFYKRCENKKTPDENRAATLMVSCANL
jgi:hypothetical protein